jgi:malonate decarboxylase delta subunit
MEQLTFCLTPGKLPAPKRKILVGVVGSGNLEVLVEPTSFDQGCEVQINTSVKGYASIWKAVCTDFFDKHPHAFMRITINDGGASPSVVTLRLEQALEMAMAESL